MMSILGFSPFAGAKRPLPVKFGNVPNPAFQGAVAAPVPEAHDAIVRALVTEILNLCDDTELRVPVRHEDGVMDTAMDLQRLLLGDSSDPGHVFQKLKDYRLLRENGEAWEAHPLVAWAIEYLRGGVAQGPSMIPITDEMRRRAPNFVRLALEPTLRDNAEARAQLKRAIGSTISRMDDRHPLTTVLARMDRALDV